MKGKKLMLLLSAVTGVILLSGGAYAALSGAGSFGNPVTGTAAAGDRLKPDVHVRNLTAKHLTTIRLEGRYTAKEYQLGFDAGEGHFPDGTSKKTVSVTYDGIIPLPETPVREGKTFAGWYLKGNGQNAGTGAAAPLLGPDSVYKIANDDAGDMALAESGENGETFARAVWRTDSYDPADGNEADDPAGGTGEKDLDPWAGDNGANRVIEWVSELPDKESYRARHGRTAFQYGRAVFSAETDLAAGYSWYVRKSGADTFEKLSETGPVLKLEQLSRNENGNVYKCRVELGENAFLEYESPLTVYHLPEIQGTAIKVNGEVI
ncbi:MAG: InlB B-repeat-containing protein [Lachnospiraceae bacterium]|nr:InlB B-repeat-containing protein [Lachnospiraceae bacterium]